MWPKRRHRNDANESLQVPDVSISDEAIEALHQAREAQQDTVRREKELRPLIRSLHDHLADDEIAVHVAATYVRRTAT